MRIIDKLLCKIVLYLFLMFCYCERNIFWNVFLFWEVFGVKCKRCGICLLMFIWFFWYGFWYILNCMNLWLFVVFLNNMEMFFLIDKWLFFDDCKVFDFIVKMWRILYSWIILEFVLIVLNCILLMLLIDM